MKDTLITALRSSGSLLLDYFNKSVKVNQKESQSSIVTEADLASDSLITEIIRGKYPDHNFLSEESGFVFNNSEYTWVVDPLDGTSNFASGIPWFGVLISLFKKNEPVLGGAYLPVTEQLYFAEKGIGSFRNNIQFKIKQNSELRNSLVAFSVDYTEDEKFLDRGIEILRFLVKNSRNIRSTNSLVDFLYVAEGKFGGCINLFTKVWDISALDLLIREAGGTLEFIHSKEIKYLITNDLLNQNFPVVAGTVEIVESLRRSILSPGN